MEIFSKDISEKRTFKSEGHLFEMVKDYGNNVYLYHRTGFETWSGKNNPIDFGYELIYAAPFKNPDGTIVHRYPSSSEWGKYGWTFKCPKGNVFNLTLKALLQKVAKSL